MSSRTDFLRDRLFVFVTILLLVVATAGVQGAASQLGESFPGFLILQNRVVASVGLSFWPATHGSEIYQKQIVAVNGEPVHSADAVLVAVRAHEPGTPIEYTLRDGLREETRVIESRTFGFSDLLLLHGLYLLNGLALGCAALVGLAVRNRNHSARAVVPLVLVGSLWALSAMDLYGPWRLFRLHAASEALLFAAALHMALAFPARVRIARRLPWLIGLPYGIAAMLGLYYQVGLHDYGSYVWNHLLAVTAFGIALLALVVSEVEHYRRPMCLRSRERVRILAIGALVALALPIVLTLAEMATGGRSPQNALTFTGFLFPLAIGYALIRDDFVRPFNLEGRPA